MYHWMHFLHAINSDRQTRFLNVFGQTAMFWEIKKNPNIPNCQNTWRATNKVQRCG